MGVGGMMRVKGGGDGDALGDDLPPSAGSTGLGVAGCGSWVCGSTSLSTPRKVEEGEGDADLMAEMDERERWTRERERT